jgi:hypothetical protein
MDQRNMPFLGTLVLENRSDFPALVPLDGMDGGEEPHCIGLEAFTAFYDEGHRNIY